ncbi:DNRLRE domain-containing protein [Micromonospora sp. NPDC003776]
MLERPDEAAALTTARITGKKVKITGLTSETSEFWALPTGSVQVEMHLGPVRMKDPDGRWTPVNFNLVQQPDGSVNAIAHPGHLRLSGPAGAGDHDLATLGTGGQQVSLGWSGPLPRPTVEGTRATYPDVRPGVDLVLEATRTGYEQFLVVKNRDAVAQVRSIPLPLRGKGLTVAKNGQGGFDIRDRSHHLIGVSPAPTMWDAAIDPRAGVATRHTTVATRTPAARAAGATAQVTLTPDQAWLTDPKTRFPVTIDPAITLKPNYDAFIESDYTSDQSGATELRAGTYDSGTTKARSLLSFRNLGWLQGKQVQAATLYLYNFHSWSCTARQWDVWETLYSDSTARWTNQPTWVKVTGYSSVTKGYSGCSGGWVNASATGAFADTANGTSSTTVNLGLRAHSETDNLAWKKWDSMEGTNDPYVNLTYNTPPTVSSRATVPSTACATGSNLPYINTTTPQLRAQITDSEGASVKAEFEWVTGGGSHIGSAIIGPGASGSWLATSVPAGAFANNTTYSWHVRGNDGSVNGNWSSYCAFIIDTTAPANAPTISSTAYPEGQWGGAVGTAGSFSLGASGVTDVSAYEYGLNTNPPNQSVNAASLGGSATVSITPTTDGPQTLYVRSRDRAGNVSPTRAYLFSVGSGAVTAPKTGDITAAKTAITGVGQAAATGVTYQWRRGDADTWTDIPAADVTVAAGGGAVTWPLPTSGNGAFPKLNWDVEATLTKADAQLIPRDGPLQVRGTFVGGTGGTSSAVKISFDRNQASAASQEIGPGSVNLVTGNYSVSDTDVSVDSYGSDLTVGRSYNTRRSTQTDSANMFGSGWVSGAVVDEASSPYTSLTVYGSLVQVGTPDGDTIGFTKKTSTDFEPEIGMEGLKLTYASATDSYALTDEDGDATTFTRVTGSAAGKYFPTAVTVPGNNQTTTLSWEKVTINNTEIVRPTRMLAPVADGVNCATLTRGCRALTFTYATGTTATGSTSDGWGDYAGRVKEISFTAWDPDLSTPAMRTVAMARYIYDDAGRLRAAWDPRLDWNNNGTTTHLWDTYDYNLNGVLSQVTPSGQQAWQLGYTTIPGDPGIGRLNRVTRSALSAGTATTTVVYKVPVSGTGAPYDLSPGQTTRWAQTEGPTDATAIFPANQVPDGDPANGALPTSYERATVNYLDANARSVDIAQPGGGISATWYDSFGNVVRTISAGDRELALNASGSDDAAAETALAKSYSTLSSYSSDGERLLWTYGPEHDVMLDNGTTIRGRNRTAYTYDEGAPNGGPYNLVTTQDESVHYWDAGGVESDTDVRRTTTQYDWNLRQATVSTVDPAGLALTSRTTYDPITGLPTSVTAPAGGTTTNTPSTRQTVYYRATSGSGYSECDLKPEWANLPCRVQPGGQAASGPELPVTVTTYDMYNQPRTVTEKTGAGTLRTTTTTYDGAGRTYETSVTAAAGLGTAVPTTRDVYDPASGQLVRTQSVVAGTVMAELIRGYDALGRLTSYTDADGNTSTTTYDLLGRIATSNDGKAERTYTYDGGTERRGLLTSVTDAQAGTFSGSYDTDGNLTTENWPNGVSVTRQVDEVGKTVGLGYAKPGCGVGDCNLYSESVTTSGHDQWREHVSTLSEQHYGYDAAGRLTAVNDIVGGQCTTRTYSFDPASNRRSRTSYDPTSDGSCQATTSSASQSWTYDSADRVNTTGYGYDALGRITSLPAVDTADPAGGAVTTTYHVTDLVDTITQGSRTTDYTLDVNGERVRSWTDNASGTAVQSTHHYDGDDDSPAWTQESATRCTRDVAGLEGLVATWDSDSGTLDWQVTNLHGDVVGTIHDADQGLSSTGESTEFGTPRDTTGIGKQRYGWLGGKQRASDTPSGITLMGVRLYNSATGRFLQVDPVYGGSCNRYDYSCQDPLNKFDLDGRCWNPFRHNCWTRHVAAVSWDVAKISWYSLSYVDGYGEARAGYGAYRFYRAQRAAGRWARFRPLGKGLKRWRRIGNAAGMISGFNDFRSTWSNMNYHISCLAHHCQTAADDRRYARNLRREFSWTHRRYARWV